MDVGKDPVKASRNVTQRCAVALLTAVRNALTGHMQLKMSKTGPRSRVVGWHYSSELLRESDVGAAASKQLPPCGGICLAGSGTWILPVLSVSHCTALGPDPRR